MDAALVARLRDNIADTNLAAPAWTDGELAALLADAGGVEPRARLAALLPLWAEAAARTDYATGTVSEKASQAFTQLRALLDQAESEVGALGTAGQQASLAVPVAVAVQVWF